MHGPYPDLNSFSTRVDRGARMPVVLEMPFEDIPPHHVYKLFRSRFGAAILLESGKGGRYSYIGRTDGPGFVVDARSTTRPNDGHVTGDPFGTLRELIGSERVIANDRLDGFIGGYVGYLAYDMARHIERLPVLATTKPAVPDCQFVCIESFCEIDHEAKRLRFVASRVCENGDAIATYAAIVDELHAMRDVMIDVDARTRPVALSVQPRVASEPAANMTQSDFEHGVRAAKSYIRAGDIFQVNLSVRFEQPFDGDPLDLYKALRAINPSPYMALLELDEVSIVSASPELLIRVRDRIVETRPIAGTRPRGATEAEDKRNARKLAENEKERAEHLMLVDLERNDIGRVARYGTVRVDELMGIEWYSHVMHIVSHVRGELAEGRDAIDAIKACFPGGTITGAPKVRSMEIIEELEPHRRGVYTGSIGWIGFDGNTELNIAIRTIVIVDGIAYAQAGAGIVADSEPEHEYHESVRKARAALEALSQT